MVAITVRMKYLKAATVLVLMAVMVSLAVLAVLSAQKGGERASLLISNEDRVAYLNRCGWVVSDSGEVREVLIPAKFNAVYEEYNRIQREQGLDLSGFKGMTAKEYTYIIKNYPGMPENVEAHLLIIDDQLVGGDVSCTKLNGFMQGLNMP